MHRVGYPAPLLRPALPACCRARDQSPLGRRPVCQRGRQFVSGARQRTSQTPLSCTLTSLFRRVVVEPDILSTCPFDGVCRQPASQHSMFGCAPPRSARCLGKDGCAPLVRVEMRRGARVARLACSAFHAQSDCTSDSGFSFLSYARASHRHHEPVNTIVVSLRLHRQQSEAAAGYPTRSMKLRGCAP